MYDVMTMASALRIRFCCCVRRDRASNGFSDTAGDTFSLHYHQMTVPTMCEVQLCT